MLSFVKLAWRNIFRNKRRTLIAGTAIGIGLGSLIFSDALIKGMSKNMIESATASYLGEGQIHRDGYRETLDLESTIAGFDSVLASVRAEKVTKAAAPRLISFAMISSPANVWSIRLVGIEPGSERRISQMDDGIVRGGYFEGADPLDLVIGSELADMLEVDVGSRVVVTSSQAYSGALAQEMFRVSGVYTLGIEELDKGMALVRIERAGEMLNLEGQAHEIALTLKDPRIARQPENPLWTKYSKGPNEAVGWPELVPQLENALAMSEFMTYVVGIILFSVVALGIMNTLFMSLHERLFEFGVMRAVGTSPFQMGRLVIFEAGSLAALSILLGAAMGLVVVYVFSVIGIDYSGIEFAGVTFREHLYPVLDIRQFLSYPVWTFVFTIIVALYPAVYAARLRPAEAMRRSF